MGCWGRAVLVLGQVLERAEGAVGALAGVALAGMQPQDLLDVTARLFTLADRLDAVLQGAIEQIHWTGATWDAANLVATLDDRTLPAGTR